MRGFLINIKEKNINMPTERQKKVIKPTKRQKEAFIKTMENCGNVSKSMREAGYSKNTAKNPKVLTESRGWEMLCEQELSDDLLIKVHKEGLKAVKNVYKNNNKTGRIELVDEEIDYQTRHKYLDTAYKIRNKVIEKVEHSGEIKKVEVIEIIEPK